MSQIFRRSANTLSKVSLFAALALVGGLILLAMVIGRSSYATRQQEVVTQPVQFSHLHHVLDDGIDCRYCHTSVETSAFAGIPPTKTCMNCHSQLFSNEAILEPVRASFRDDTPLRWVRVHDLPDFVYFNHAVHVRGGVGCVACHGRVDQMARVYKVAPLNMGWCLDCHQNAEEWVKTSRPSAVARLASLGEVAPATDQPALWGTFPTELVAHGSLGPKKLDALTTCTACHR